MKKLYSFLSSSQLMGILLLIIAVAMAIATFIETKNSTAAAQVIVYKSKWFEVLLIILCINLLLNIYQHRLLSKKKIVVGLFHLSFVIILIGAAITRYVGFEGVVNIRENSSTNYLTSSERYVTIFSNKDTLQKKVLFSEITPNGFSEELFVEDEKIIIKSVQFIKNVKTNNHSTNDDAVVFDIQHNHTHKKVTVFSSNNTKNTAQNININGNILKIAYGTIKKPLPFSLYLNDFQIEKYLGSDTPSSYKSLITIQKGQEKRKAEIFMNNTLSINGYKFFQSSYDLDERGTVLTVNHDFWGTRITYLGYALMIIGIILALIGKNTRFRALINRLKESADKTVLVIVLLMFFSTVKAQEMDVKNLQAIDKDLVNQFERIWVQGADGRIEPISTFSSEIVRKITKQSYFKGKKPAELILSMSVYPNYWSKVPLIRVSNKTLAKELNSRNKYLSVSDFFDSDGRYKIARRVHEAYAKSPALRNRVEKELIYVDERVNIAYMVFEGSVLNIFPRKESSKSWYAPGDIATDFTGGDSIFIKSGYQFLINAIKQNNVEEAKLFLNAIEKFQNNYGKEILPSQQKCKAELFYNKFNPFKTIFPFYLALGFIILFVLFFNIFRNKPLPKLFHLSAFTLAVILFLIHTAALILRGYISGHAPWSNGYESLIYVSWTVMFAGFIVGRKYSMVVGIATFLTGISLFVAHLSWMNPEITNLVPVLQSYWLTIHVAIITASYGFIGLSAFIGILVMILIVITTTKNKYQIEKNIQQLTIINEMSVTVGLYFLIIGTFFGAIWANESWGRYWGWDPKETWSLITVFIYSFIVHMRMIPKIKSSFAFNVATIVGFSSVIMTYFGVNYYLTGLHSYGKGIINNSDQGILVVVAGILALIIVAYIKNRKDCTNHKKSALR